MTLRLALVVHITGCGSSRHGGWTNLVYSKHIGKSGLTFSLYFRSGLFGSNALMLALAAWSKITILMPSSPSILPLDSSIRSLHPWSSSTNSNFVPLTLRQCINPSPPRL